MLFSTVRAETSIDQACLITAFKSPSRRASALAGAAVTIAGLRAKVSPTLMTVLGALACFALRIVAVWRHWNLPRVGHA